MPGSRFLFLAAALPLALTGCAPTAEELLPIPAAIKNASVVARVEVVVQPSAAAAVALLDEKARSRGSSEATAQAALPFARLIETVIGDVTREWGLTTGRRLTLVVEIDEISTADAVSALVGKQDRLAGSVFVQDATSQAPLGQLYIDIANSNAGLIGLATRGGGVREQLARQLAEDIARALTGRRERPR